MFQRFEGRSISVLREGRVPVPQRFQFDGVFPGLGDTRVSRLPCVP